MKTAIKTTKMITMALCVLCMSALTNATFAKTSSKDPGQLKFIGNNQNQPVFRLSLNNEEAGEYIIKIMDADYNSLYSEKVKGTNLSRSYQLDIDEADLSSYGFGVRVEVSSAKSHKTEVYKISSETKVTSNIVLAQL